MPWDPAEPPGSHLHELVRHRAYPCQEVGGVIFTYLGPGEPPLLPNYEVLSAPPEDRIMTKHYTDCDYLQGLEGSEDTTHVRFLHRFLRTESGVRKRDEHPTELAGNGYAVPVLQGYTGPVQVEENDFSVWATYANGVSAPEYTFPSLCLTGGGPQAPGNGYQVYWRVPIDDTCHWQFSFAYERIGAIPEEHRYSRTWAMMTPTTTSSATDPIAICRTGKNRKPAPSVAWGPSLCPRTRWSTKGRARFKIGPRSCSARPTW